MNHHRVKFIGLFPVIALWLSMCLWAWGKPADETSLSERRTLAQLPELTVESILSTGFMEDFASYAVDQFPLRDGFRQLKALATYFGFGQRDNNGIYIANGSAVKMEYPLDEASLDYAIQRFQQLYDLYLKDGANILFSIVPDKGYYLAEASGHLSMDYEALFETMEQSLPWAEFVDITGCLTADSYYRTDTHWCQESLFPVAQRLCEALAITPPRSGSFRPEVATQEFHGVYSGQSALPMEPDVLRYLTWPGWEDCTVYSYDTGETTSVYDLGKLESKDPYDIFLSGGMAIQTVTNPNAAEARELIVFRDSFGSSLVPLLAQAYSTITLVDTRYISPVRVGNYVNFQDKDVLMLYSTLVLNSSGTLRK